MNGPATAARETSMSPMAVSSPGRSTAHFGEKQVALRSPGSDNAEASGPVSLTREVIPQSGFRSVEAGFALAKGPRGGERERSSSEGAPAQTPSPVAPLSMAPPALDINAVADKVYQALVRRHRFEQERRGLY